MTVGSLLLFIQSKYFAELLKQGARHYMPSDFGVDGDFSELAVKMIPPGVVIKNPAVVFKEKNPAGLPSGTKLDAQFIDITFQFFQLLTGEITVNAVAIHGATLKLVLDRQFLARQEKAFQPRKKRNSIPSWDSLLRFNFRSVSLVESQIDLTFESDASPLRIQSYAKELTIGRSTVDEMPGYDLAIDFQKAFVETRGFKHSLAQFQASVELSSDGISIRNLSMQDADLIFHTNGVIRGNLLNPTSLKSDLSCILRGPIKTWFNENLIGRFVKLPKGVPLEGGVVIDGKLQGDLLNLAETVEVKASVQFDQLRYDEWRADKALVKGAWKGSSIALDLVEIMVAGGTVRATNAAYDLNKREQVVQAAVEFDKADFRKLAGPILRSVYPLHMIINGNANVNVSMGQKFGLTGNANLVVNDFSLDNQKPDLKKPLKVVLAVPEIALKSNFKIGPEGASFDQTEATLPHSKLLASGSITEANGFNLDIKGDIDLTDVGKIAEIDIGGAGSLHWTITGKKPYIIFTFDADVKEAHYLRLKLGAVKGKVIYNDGNDTLSFQKLNAVQGRTEMIADGTINTGDLETVDMKVQVPTGTVEDFATVFSSFIKESIHWYPWDLTGKMSGVIDITGKTDMNYLSALGDMELQNVDFRREIFRYAKLRAGYRRGSYVAENVAIQKKAGWIKGDLSFDADSVLKFDAKSEGLTTYDVDHLAIFGVPYRAPVQLEMRGTGKIGLLKSAFKLAVGEGTIKTHPVAPSEVSVATENGRVTGSFSAFGDHAKGQIHYGWANGSNSSFEIDARNFDFRPVLIALNPDMSEDPALDALLTANTQLRFQTGTLSRMSGQLAFDTYRLRRTGYSLELERPVKIELRDGNYQFENARFTGTDTALTANGRVKNGIADYDIKGNFSLGILEFMVKEIAALKGSAKVEARLTGNADSPDFNADIVSNGADLRLRHLEQLFEDVRFKAKWSNANVKVSDINAKFAGGSIRGEGTASVYYYKAPDLDFKIDLDNSKVKVYPVSYARTSGKMSCRGTSLPYKVKGSLYVAEALVKENFNPGDGGRASRSSKFLPQVKGSVAGDLELFDLDIDIAADRNIFIKNDLFDAELKGNLKIINTLTVPRMLGNIGILHGRLLFKDNFFTVQSGDLRFNNPSALDPEFDLSGQTELKGYKILLVAGGKTSDYRLNFQSQPPLSQNDIVNLLTLGITSSDFKNISRENRDAYSRDELYGILFNQSGINKGLQEKLGVKVKVDQTQANNPENVFRARQSTDATESVAPKVILQKQITKNLNASVGSTVGVGGSQERNADVEFGIDRNWSILGTYEDQRGSQLRQSRTSIGADLKYRLRFK